VPNQGLTEEVGNSRGRNRPVRTSTDPSGSGSIPVGLTATMMVVMGVGPLLLYALSSLGPLLVADLDLSRTQLGSLSTVAFGSAALIAAAAGSSVDQRSARKGMWILLGGGSLGLLVAAVAPLYAVLLAAVVVSGGAQALSNPITNRLVTLYTPAPHRGTVMGLKQSGVQLAQAVAGLALPAIALLGGWRWATAAAALHAVLGAALVARFVPHERPEGGGQRGGQRGQRGAPVARSSTTERRSRLPRSVWWLTGYAFLSGAAVQAANLYLPLYGHEALGMPTASAGLVLTVVGGIGLVARIGWGRLSNRFSPTPSLLVIAGAATLGVLLIELAQPLDTRLVWVGAGLLGATGVAANVVLMVGATQVVPLPAVGRVTGVVASGMYLGFAAGPVIFGAVVDGTGEYGYAWTGVATIYVLAALLVLTRTMGRRLR